MELNVLEFAYLIVVIYWFSFLVLFFFRCFWIFPLFFWVNSPFQRTEELFISQLRFLFSDSPLPLPLYRLLVSMLHDGSKRNGAELFDGLLRFRVNFVWFLKGCGIGRSSDPALSPWICIATYIEGEIDMNPDVYIYPYACWRVVFFSLMKSCFDLRRSFHL